MRCAHTKITAGAASAWRARAHISVAFVYAKVRFNGDKFHFNSAQRSSARVLILIIIEIIIHIVASAATAAVANWSAKMCHYSFHGTSAMMRACARAHLCVIAGTVAGRTDGRGGGGRVVSHIIIRLTRWAETPLGVGRGSAVKSHLLQHPFFGPFAI